MRIPSKKSFTDLEEAVTPSEWDVLSGSMNDAVDSEYLAFLVLTGLRNGVSLSSLKKAPESGLNVSDNFRQLITAITPTTSSSEIDSFFWSLPLEATDADRLYLTSAYLSYGQSFSSLLSSFRSSNNTNLPEFVPVSWYKKFFIGEEALREEGIVLQADVSMILFGYWTIAEVVDFLIRNVNLKEVTKLRSYGIEGVEEIADMTELLPSEWLDEFFV